jgi:hypothetical protein
MPVLNGSWSGSVLLIISNNSDGPIYNVGYYPEIVSSVSGRYRPRPNSLGIGDLPPCSVTTVNIRKWLKSIWPLSPGFLYPNIYGSTTAGSLYFVDHNGAWTEAGTAEPARTRQVQGFMDFNRAPVKTNNSVGCT